MARARRTGRAAAALVAMTAAAAGCTSTPSPLDPDQQVSITASVVEGSAPVEDVPVRVVAGLSSSDLLTLPFSLLCGGACGDLDEKATTDPSGRVVIDTTAATTQTALGEAREVSVLFSDPRPAEDPAIGRGGVAQSFLLLTPHLELPPVTFWRPQVAARPDGSSLLVDFAPIEGEGTSYRWAVDDLQGNRLAAPQDVAPGGRVDARPLEDLAGRMVVTASRSEADVRTTWRSPVVAVQGGLTPPSRGASCTRFDRAGAPTTSDPCPATDGSTLTAAPPAVGDCTGVPQPEEQACHSWVDELRLDLSTIRSVELVVVRGGGGPATVQTSRDGAAWEELGSADDPVLEQGFAVRSGAARPTRYVRVLHARDVTEVSAW